MLHVVLISHHVLVAEVSFLLVARVSELDEQRFLAAGQDFLVERVNNLVAHLPRLHPTESHAPRLATWRITI